MDEFTNFANGGRFFWNNVWLMGYVCCKWRPIHIKVVSHDKNGLGSFLLEDVVMCSTILHQWVWVYFIIDCKGLTSVIMFSLYLIRKVKRLGWSNQGPTKCSQCKGVVERSQRETWGGGGLGAFRGHGLWNRVREGINVPNVWRMEYILVYSFQH